MDDSKKGFYSNDEEMNKKVAQNVKTVLEIVDKYKDKTEENEDKNKEGDVR